MLKTRNKYGPIQVSNDKYLKLLTEQEVNHESSNMGADVIFAVKQENHSRRIPTHTEEYGLLLNGRSLCAKSVITNLLLPTEWAAARNF